LLKVGVTFSDEKKKSEPFISSFRLFLEKNVEQDLEMQHLNRSRDIEAESNSQTTHPVTLLKSKLISGMSLTVTSQN
jgi:hypothetical protein